MIALVRRASRLQRARGTEREAGFSLPELIITMALLGLVTTLVLMITVTVGRVFSRDRAQTDSLNVSAIGMEELTRMMRAGTEIKVSGAAANDPVFVTAKPEEAVFYALADANAADPKPIKVRFQVSAGRVLTETRWAATETMISGQRFFTWPATTPVLSTKNVARRIVAPAAGDKPVFEYLDKNNDPITFPPVPTKSDLRAIVAVRITLKVQADLTGRAAPVKIENVVGIPNLGIPRVGP